MELELDVVAHFQTLDPMVHLSWHQHVYYYARAVYKQHMIQQIVTSFLLMFVWKVLPLSIPY